jgi:hypothetical protein
MAALTTAKRNSLPSSSFVFPKERAFPIDTRNRAKAAVAMGAGARSGKPQSPARQATIRAAVSKKYPGLGKSRRYYGEK